MVLAIGVMVGFVLVPPLARANAQLVNGFLFLILFSSLLYHRTIWLPYLEQFSTAAGGGTTKPHTTAFDKAHHATAQ